MIAFRFIFLINYFFCLLGTENMRKQFDEIKKEISTSDELKSWPHGILRFIKNIEAVSPVYGEFVTQMCTAFLKLVFR